MNAPWRSAFVFVSERGAPFTTSGFAKLLERAGIEAKLGFKLDLPSTAALTSSKIR